MTGAAEKKGQGGAGAWSDVERSQFEKGIIVHGWSNWTLIGGLIPSRSINQIKSHAQKFRKYHGEECDALKRKHVERKKQMHERATNAQRDKTASARRMGGPKSGSATTKAKASRPSARGPARPLHLMSSKFAGPIKPPIVKPAANPAEPPAAPIPVLSPLDTLTEVTSSDCCVCLAGKVALSTNPNRRAALPSGIVSVGFRDSVSPGPDRSASALELNLLDEDLAALSAVTPSPAPRFSNVYEHLLDDSSLDHAPTLAKVDEANCKIDPCATSLAKAGEANTTVDPLPQFDVDNDDLATIDDFLDPSWSVLLPNDPALGRGVAPATAFITSRGSFTFNHIPDFGDASTPALKSSSASLSCGLDEGEAFEMVRRARPEPRHYLEMRSLLAPPPDLGDPGGCVAGGVKIGSLDVAAGAACRARIKGLLAEHLEKSWWREDASTGNGSNAFTANGATTRGISNNLAWADSDGKNALKKFALERLIALTAVMLELGHWHASRQGQRFDDEDDVCHVGQLLTGLWERVNRSLNRDRFALMETNSDGGADSSTRMERHAAIDQMVSRLDAISREQGDIESSPRGAVCARA